MDILVHNAFGSLRDVLREVSYSPVMAKYLTYVGNRKFASRGTYPVRLCKFRHINRKAAVTMVDPLDFLAVCRMKITHEKACSFSRSVFTRSIWTAQSNVELMESHWRRTTTMTCECYLFTYHLLCCKHAFAKLNESFGCFVNHSQTMARMWTGFDLQPTRGNVANYYGNTAKNVVDPLKINAEWRDIFPKMDLSDGYIGDTVVPCVDLPARRFLRTGARYEYLGETPTARLQGDSAYITPSTASALYQLLCAQSGGGGSPCQFPAVVTLGSSLGCHGIECQIDTVRMIAVFDLPANKTVYYEYVPPACVTMPFYENAVQTKGSWDRVLCADPRAAVAGTACCADNTSANLKVPPMCQYRKEKVTLATAVARCAAASKSVCTRHNCVQPDEVCHYGSQGASQNTCVNANVHMRTWMTRPCGLQVQVDPSGVINVVHSHPSVLGTWADGGSDSTNPETALNSHNAFRVGWLNNAWPKAGASNCSYPLCVTHGATCLCDTDVTTVAVFTAASSVPTRAQILASLHIGAPNPNIFDTGLYSMCSQQQQSDVVVWGAQQSGGCGTYDSDTIFQITDTGKILYLANKQSTVRVRNAANTFQFRNPPSFMALDESTTRDASYETEALLDHLFYHSNTAPFISHRLIQRFTSSNPSPRYVNAVATAFTTGTYNGHTYGEYGSLAATIAAILLDQEARSPTLHLDRTHGLLREPLLKVLHVLRSLEFQSRDGREIELNNMFGKIAQQAYEEPSVFNFYSPEYSPPGPVGALQLYSPEAEIATTPQVVAFLNGMQSLFFNGLTSCNVGFGSATQQRNCNHCNGKSASTADGVLGFAPQSNSTADVVSELDLLLTGGRLNPQSAAIIRREHAAMLATVDYCTQNNALRTATPQQNALHVAQTLFMATVEFHSTNAATVHSTARTPASIVQASGQPYKAIVVVFMNGGCDSFNVLVPHSQCTANSNKDMYAEYASVRGEVKLAKSSLLQIVMPSGHSQPCTNFGIHPQLGIYKSLYDQGDAAFFANIGSLVEPVTKTEFQAKSKLVPPSLFAHNTQQRQSQSVYAQNMAAKGVLGRIRDALGARQSTPLAANAYSITGSMKIVEGSTTAHMINKNYGMAQLSASGTDQAPIRNAIFNLTGNQCEQQWSSCSLTCLLIHSIPRCMLWFAGLIAVLYRWTRSWLYLQRNICCLH